MPRHRSARVLAALLPLAVIACDDSPTEPRGSASLTVNASEFVAMRITTDSAVPQYRLTIVTRMRNTGSAPLYLTACGTSPAPVFGIELVSPSDPEGSAFNPIWACPAGRPYVLAVGAERTDTLTLRAPGVIENGRARGVVEGTMRVVYSATTCSLADTCTSSASGEVRLASTSFSVRRP